jgi:hypothetical protein
MMQKVLNRDIFLRSQSQRRHSFFNDILDMKRIINQSSSQMSFIHNFHQPPVFYVNGIKYVNDYDLEEYRP